MSDFDPTDWDKCCTRCHVLMDWEGDLPEAEENAICRLCAWDELMKLRARLAKLEPAARAVLSNMIGTCDYGEPSCTAPSFAGFMHGMCEAHADELGAPVGALKDQTLVNNLKKTLEGL